MYSRLERKYTSRDQRKAVILIIGSLIIAAVLLIYGLPLVFNLTGAISNLNRKSTVETTKTIAPNIPIFFQNYAATFSATIKIAGTADPNATIEIFQNGVSLGTNKADDTGKFLQTVDLEKGQNIFTAVAINDNGQKSEPSESYFIKLITTKPKLDVLINDKTITGQTDQGNSVAINDRLIIVDKDGKFSLTPNLASGENKFLIVAVDPAGNQTKKELTIQN